MGHQWSVKRNPDQVLAQRMITGLSWARDHCETLCNQCTFYTVKAPSIRHHKEPQENYMTGWSPSRNATHLANKAFNPLQLETLRLPSGASSGQESTWPSPLGPSCWWAHSKKWVRSVRQFKNLTGVYFKFKRPLTALALWTLESSTQNSISIVNITHKNNRARHCGQKSSSFLRNSVFI